MNDLYFFSGLPSLNKTLSLLKKPAGSIALVICDSKLKSSPLLKSWRASPSARFYFARAGEEAKSIEKLPFHLKNALSRAQGLGPKDLVFIGLGGGSIGDFTGFLASIYKRGAPLALFPSTWLAALDSAHGGKNALNFRRMKNIVGTYHFPEAVFISLDLLKGLSESQIESAYGELLKTSLIAGGGLHKKLKDILSQPRLGAPACAPEDFSDPGGKKSRENRNPPAAKIGKRKQSSYKLSKQISIKSSKSEKAVLHLKTAGRNKRVKTAPASDSQAIAISGKGSKKRGFDRFPLESSSRETIDLSPQNMERALRQLLKKAIAAKMKIIAADPYEKKSIRKKLNLGHTAGHIIESSWKLPHGLAVLHGLLFSLKWSLQKGFLSERYFKEITALIPDSIISSSKKKRKKQISLSMFKKLLWQDKKRLAIFQWSFLFVRRPGQVFAKAVSEEELLKEAKRQGIIKG